MKVIPFTFTGPCVGCHTSKEDRPAVSILVDDEDGEDEFGGIWLCLRCARGLVGKVRRAADKAQKNTRAGIVYRHGKWAKPSAKEFP